MLTNDAGLAFGQLIARGKSDTFDGLKKTSRRILPDMAHAVMPEIHCFGNFGKENQLGSAPVRRVDKFEIHKVQVVRLDSLVDIVMGAIGVLSCDGEFSIIHDTCDFTPNSRHSANR